MTKPLLFTFYDISLASLSFHTLGTLVFFRGGAATTTAVAPEENLVGHPSAGFRIDTSILELCPPYKQMVAVTE